MKKLRFYLVAVMLAFLTMPILQSCLDSSDSSYPDSLLAIGTLEIIEGREYFFNLDDGDKMYPSDTTYIHNYELVDGQRVFVQFLPLEEDKPGYEYNVKLIQLQNILTKDIIPLTEETVDSIGNDRINVGNLWIAGKFLNIEHQFYHSNNPDKKHMLNLVINKTSKAPAPEGDYINLEFRHNAFNDEQREPSWGVASFRLDEIADQLEGKKGLKILVNSIYDGKRTYTVELNKKK